VPIGTVLAVARVTLLHGTIDTAVLTVVSTVLLQSINAQAVTQQGAQYSRCAASLQITACRDLAEVLTWATPAIADVRAG
jgi:hypothetical protein